MIQKSIEEAIVKIEKHFLKEHEAQYAGGDDRAVGAVEEEVMEEPVEEEMGMDSVELEGASEYPMKEEEFDEDMSPEKMYKSFKKQLTDLTAAIPALVMKEATKLSEATLQKQGFRKEISRQPQITNAMGLDQSDYAISKSKGSDEKFDITEVSYKDLYNAKMARDAGTGTSELPSDFFRG
jgi:hypothetical protein